MKHLSSVSRAGINLANRHGRIRSEERIVHKHVVSSPPKESAARIFRGLRLPDRPRAPSSEDCCMSRCDPCVHDIFLKSLERYHHDIIELRRALINMGIPQEEWPEEIIIQTQVHQHWEDNAVAKDERAAVENAKRVLESMGASGVEKRTNYREFVMEAGRLVLWTLRGCPG